PTILFVGGMDPSHYFKGIEVLISALRILQQKRIPFQAIFVGEGSLRTKFELEVKGFGLEKSIHFVGGASESDLPRYYNLADLFVLPSLNRAEAFGMVLLESMASGVPVLASDLPGVRTVAQKGGGVVEPNDPMKLAEAIIEYFEVDLQERKCCAHEVRDVVEKWYSWEFVAQELDKIYTDLQKN
ncbi:MAG: glycosyltransferase family 4 protein, partial [Candidatus Magasanikbacteria bacterium]